MIRNEFAKLFRRQHFAVLILLYLVMHSVTIGTGIFTEQSGTLRAQYIKLLEPYAGQITVQTEQKIEARKAEILRARTEQNMLKSRLEAGSITQAEYAEKMQAYQAALHDADAFDILYRQYEFADESPKNRWLLDRTGWDALLSTEQTDFPLIFLILLLTVLLFCGDAESHAEESISVCQHGRTGLLRARLLTGTAVLSAVSVLSFLCAYAICALRYGLPIPSAPIQSLQAFSSSPYALTLAKLFGCVVIVRTLGAVCLFWLFSAAAMLTKRVLPAVIVGVLLYAVPFLLYSGDLQYRVPFAHGLLAGTGFFRGDSEFVFDKDFVVIATEFHAVSLRTAVLAAAGCLLIACLSAWTALRIRAGVLVNSKSFAALPCIVLCCALFAGMSCRVLYREPEHFETEYTAGHGFSSANFSLTDTYGITCIPAKGDPFSLPIDLSPDPEMQYKSCFSDSKDIYILKHHRRTGMTVISRLDYPALHETEIFRTQETVPDAAEQSLYLDLVRDNGFRNVSANEMYREMISHFWLDGDWLYLESGTEIRRYHLRTHRSETIMTEPHQPGALCYANGRIYYPDTAFSLCFCDVSTGKLKRADSIFCTGVAWDGEALICRSLDGHLFRADADLQRAEQISDVTLPDSSLFSVSGNAVYFVGTDGKAYCVQDGETDCIYEERPLMQIFPAGDRLMLYFADQRTPFSALLPANKSMLKAGLLENRSQIIQLQPVIRQFDIFRKPDIKQLVCFV